MGYIPKLQKYGRNFGQNSQCASEATIMRLHSQFYITCQSLSSHSVKAREKKGGNVSADYHNFLVSHEMKEGIKMLDAFCVSIIIL